MAYSTPTAPTGNGSSVAIWRAKPSNSPNAPLARVAVRITSAMLKELLTMAQAGQWSGTDSYHNQNYIEVKASVWSPKTPSETSPQMSGKLQTPSEAAQSLAAYQAKQQANNSFGQAPAPTAGGWGASPAPAGTSAPTW